MLQHIRELRQAENSHKEENVPLNKLTLKFGTVYPAFMKVYNLVKDMEDNSETEIVQAALVTLGLSDVDAYTVAVIVEEASANENSKAIQDFSLSSNISFLNLIDSPKLSALLKSEFQSVSDNMGDNTFGASG